MHCIGRWVGGVNVCVCELCCTLRAHTLQVPSPLTAEMEAVRKDKLAEKNRAKKKQKREREKQTRDVRDLDRISEAQQKAEENLSEREKVRFRMAAGPLQPSLNVVALRGMCLYLVMLQCRCWMPVKVPYAL